MCGKVPLLAQHRHISQPRRQGPHFRETGTPLRVLAAHTPPPEHQVRHLMCICIAQTIRSRALPFQSKVQLQHACSLASSREHANASVQFHVLRQTAAPADEDEAQNHNQPLLLALLSKHWTTHRLITNNSEAIAAAALNPLPRRIPSAVAAAQHHRFVRAAGHGSRKARSAHTRCAPGFEDEV